MLAGPVHVSEASLLYGLTMVTRLLAIFATSSLFVLTTDPVDFVVALIQQARLPVRVGYAIPLLAISVRRAERVALAMDSRGFGARPDRTYYRVTTITRADLLFGAAAAAALVVIVFGPRALGL
jgi:energy-coupling factor transport system permease protein